MSVKGVVRLLVPAAKATPSPAIGQALGPLGVNMMEFCKSFNARTEGLKDEVPIPVVLTAFSDRSFTFVTKTPPSSWFLKRVAGVEKGSASAGSENVGQITTKQIYEIAQIKCADEHLQGVSLKAMCRSLVGTAQSMGIAVVARPSEGNE